MTPTHETCLLLTAPAAALPERLVGGLSARGLAVLWATDPASAMLRVAQGGCVALIVVEPQEGSAGDRQEELIQAMRTYDPGVLRWAYREAGGRDGEPWLGPWEDDRNGRGQGEPTEGKSVDTAGVDQARAPDLPSGKPPSRPAVGDRQPEIDDMERWVSEQELAMLLDEARS